MEIFLIYLFVLNAIKFGQTFHLNDEEVLSDITFFNKSYAELRLLTSNQLVNVWLKPYLSADKMNEQIIDEKCVFNGQVVIGKVMRGTAIISICGQQITGIFDLNGTMYSLNPYNSWKSSSFRTDNEVWRKKRTLAPDVLSRIRHDPDDSAICANSFPEVEKVVARVRGYEMGEDKPNIYFGKATIKLAVFMDELLFKHRFDANMTESKEFVAINIAFLQKQLQKKNILRNIDFRVVVVHFSIAPFYETHKWDILTYQRLFCEWARNSTYYSNVNILLTGATLWWVVEGKLSTRIKGLAAVGQLCSSRYSCLIVEAREGFKSVRVLVHEFGHNMGAQHDGKEEHKTTSCNPNDFIMSWAVGNGKNTWSQCSTKLMRLLLLSMKRDESTNQIQCLKGDVEPKDSLLDISQTKYRKPGLRVTADQQCRLVFGPRFSYHYQDESNICLRMKCKDDFYVTTTWGAMEGTECGQNRKCDVDRCRRMPLGDFNKYVKLGVSKLRYVQN